ncbi:MAG: outer membrane protein assembly factor, partial [Flavobacteriales bacterium]
MEGEPEEYVIGDITVTGAVTYSPQAIRLFSGLKKGQKITIPGKDIPKAIRNIWEQDLFKDIKIRLSKVEDKKVYLDIKLKERTRLTKYKIRGVKNSDKKDIREQIGLVSGSPITKNLINETKRKIRAYYIDEGYYNASSEIIQKKDTSANGNILIINVNKGERVKVNKIVFHGNEEFTDNKLRRTMDNVKVKKWYRIFKASKFVRSLYKKDKSSIIDLYNENGFRDAKIVNDTVYRVSKDELNIEITIREGDKYYFRNIKWVGNKKYSGESLSKVLGIRKGDVYNKKMLDKRLRMNRGGTDVSSLYMDNGYLFFRVTPIETRVKNDSIDIKMKVYEGKQARVDEVIVKGNTKTNDRVVLREIRTRPGDLFKRSDIVRSQRELSQLGFFNPEKMQVNPIPNQEEGTVDIIYKVEEKPSDQIELSAG